MATGHRCLAVLAAVIGLATLSACERQHAEDPAAKPTGRVKVAVSVLPQRDIVERVGGDRVEVSVLVPPGRSPATYAPTPKQIAALSEARILFRVGLPFEDGLLRKLTGIAKGMEIVDTRQGVALRDIEEHDHGHSHGEGKDPHIWLAPKLVKIQARTVSDALSKIDPAHRTEYGERTEAFIAALDAAQQEVASLLAPYRGRAFYVFHPAYGYFADAFGLVQKPIELGGKSPAPAQLQSFIEEARTEKIRTVFVQPQFDASAAETIADALGGQVVALDPLAPDMLANLEEMAAKIVESFAE